MSPARTIHGGLPVLTVLMGLVLGGAGLKTALAQDVGTISLRDATAGSGIDTGAGAVGVSTFDFNDDGLDDITFARRDVAPALLRNNGDGTFTDVTASSGITSTGMMMQPIWVDVNRDALPDLFMGMSAMGTNALWLNQGDGTFQDVAETWGMDLRARVGAATFGDFSGDGYPDLFIGVENGYDLLYRNVDGTGFEDVSEAFGVQGDPFSIPMQATWVDVDEDGDVDLFVTHDEDVPNFLYMNQDGVSFAESAAAWGIREIGAGNSMGVAWGDPDMDGDLDVYVTRIGIAGFYRFNRATGRFFDEATPWRVAQNGVGWGTYFVDLDNDMDEDLVAVHSQTAGFPPPVLFVNQTVGEGPFFDPVLEAGDFDFIISDLGLAVGDFNDDGRPDVITGNSRGEHRLLLNETTPAGNWMSVELRESDAIPGAMGARLELDVDGRTLVRVLQAGDGYVSQNSTRVHFGLGSAESADDLRVRWPDGSWQSFGALAANSRHVIQDGSVVTTVESMEQPENQRQLERDQVQIWPNPAAGQLRIAADLTGGQGGELILRDLHGRIVLRQRVRSGSVRETLDVSGLAGGVYLITLHASGSTLRQMVVVQ